MSRHHEDCPGESCLRCQRDIELAQDAGDDYADSDWQTGQDRYEAHLDRMGGSA